MDNLETMATLGTQDTERKQTKQITQNRKLKRCSKNPVGSVRFRDSILLYRKVFCV